LKNARKKISARLNELEKSRDPSAHEKEESIRSTENSEKPKSSFQRSNPKLANPFSTSRSARFSFPISAHALSPHAETFRLSQDR